VDWRVMLSALGLLFVAELGDKTQLAVICMTAQTRKPLPVFVGVAIALIIVTLLGAAFGVALASIIPIHILRKVAAGLFIVMGALMFFNVL
jgi:putative Ca2+/H+ antiporter (TMEM165/GDT1 family)